MTHLKSGDAGTLESANRREGEAAESPADSSSGRSRASTPGVFEELTAADLPGLMEAECRRGPYRVPLAQFISDWNRSADPGTMVLEEPSYTGDDPELMPTVAAVVHALCERDAMKPPEWVFNHRASRSVVLFASSPYSNYGRWVQEQSPPVSKFHRVYFQPQLLDKGSTRQWDPIPG